MKVFCQEEFVIKLSLKYLYPVVGASIAGLLLALSVRGRPLLQKSLLALQGLTLVPYYLWYAKSRDVVQGIAVHRDGQTVSVNKGIFQSSYTTVRLDSFKSLGSTFDLNDVQAADLKGNPVRISYMNKPIYIEESGKPVELKRVRALFNGDEAAFKNYS